MYVCLLGKVTFRYPTATLGVRMSVWIFLTGGGLVAF